jgi:hypothetical protein
VTVLLDVRDVNSPCGLGLGVSVAAVVFAESATKGGTVGGLASHCSAAYAEEWGTRFLCVVLMVDFWRGCLVALTRAVSPA